jgi:tRNA U34 2-thiouridine synthase MnmA/TrmU
MKRVVVGLSGGSSVAAYLLQQQDEVIGLL